MQRVTSEEHEGLATSYSGHSLAFENPSCVLIGGRWELRSYKFLSNTFILNKIFKAE